MALASTPLDQLTLEHLQRLVDDAVVEARALEYKESVGRDDAAKREFLADISSFANAAGGDLLVGVAEKDGAAAALRGVEGSAADAEILRLENIARDGIEPRIPGVRMRAVAVAGDAAVIVIRIPRSWAAPHMVTFQGLSRFYSRNSAGKYPLDASEIRGAFVASEGAHTYLRSFRLERLGRLTANDGPVELTPNPKTVLHVIPLSAVDATTRFNVIGLCEAHNDYFRPLYGTAWNRRINFDGALAYAPHPSGLAGAYTQVFHTGAIEGVEAVMLRRESGSTPHKIPSASLERALIEALDTYAQLLRELDVPGPFLLALSLLDVRDLEMAVDVRRFESGHPIDRPDLIIPETVVDDLSQPADVLLKPHLDAIWNATGHPGSLNYNNQGRWRDKYST
jgi:hypothetical protein